MDVPTKHRQRFTLFVTILTLFLSVALLVAIGLSVPSSRFDLLPGFDEPQSGPSYPDLTPATLGQSGKLQVGRAQELRTHQPDEHDADEHQADERAAAGQQLARPHAAPPAASSTKRCSSSSDTGRAGPKRPRHMTARLQ